MAPDDQTLIARCRADDREAFKELVQRYQKRVYGIAVGMLHSPEDAMDVTQEVFIKVHMYMGRFKGTSSFYTWLYRIAVNLCIDHLRRESKLQKVDYDDTIVQREEVGEFLAGAQALSPLRSLDQQELSNRIQRALQGLSPNHRAVLLMREVEGLSYAQMAEIMQCSLGTIMSRLFHARRRMQEALLAEQEQEEA